MAFELLSDYFESPAEAIRFMRAFAGIVVAVPPMPAVERLASESRIAAALSADPTTQTVRRLSSIHSIPMRAVARSFSKSTGRGLKDLRVKQSS